MPSPHPVLPGTVSLDWVCPISQGMSRRIPFTLNGGRERVFRPNPLPFPNYCAFSLNRGRERAFVSFLCLFLVYRLLSFFLLAKTV